MFRIALTMLTTKSKMLMDCQHFLDIYQTLKGPKAPTYSLEEHGSDTIADSLKVKELILLQDHQVSKTKYLLDSTYGVKWATFCPPHKIDLLREKFTKILLSSDKKNQRKSFTASVNTDNPVMKHRGVSFDKSVGENTSNDYSDGNNYGRRKSSMRRSSILLSVEETK